MQCVHRRRGTCAQWVFSPQLQHLTVREWNTRDSLHWKSDEDHAALIVNGGPLMWPVIAYHAKVRRHIVRVLLGRP